MILEHHISENVLNSEALGIFFTGGDISEASSRCGSDLAFLVKNAELMWGALGWESWRAARWRQWQGWLWATQVLGNMDLLNVQASQMAGHSSFEP